MNTLDVDSCMHFKEVLKYFSAEYSKVSTDQHVFPLSVDVTEHDDEPDKLMAFLEISSGHLYAISWPKENIELTRENRLIIESRILAELVIGDCFRRVNMSIN